MAKKILSVKQAAEYISLSKATINRRRNIGDFPGAIMLGGNRIGFLVEELDEWVETRPRKIDPEVNDNKKSVRCPTTNKGR